ncbi:MAG: hypothetical protein HRT99_01850 [Mycoplasmatales bacterium]|nr:hypothetical protein [Mycoplasmatales bacterium]
MIKAVLEADVRLSYKTKKEFKKAVEILKKDINEFKKMDLNPINELLLINFIKSYNKLSAEIQFTSTYLDVQFNSDTRKTNLLDELDEIYDIEIEFNLMNEKFFENLIKFGREKVIKMINSNQDLLIWKETFLFWMRSQIKIYTQKENAERKKYKKEFNDMYLEAEKIGNKPIKKHFEYEGKKYTNDETEVLSIDPSVKREIRKLIFLHSIVDKRENEKEIGIIVSKYINKSVEYIKKFGYKSYQHFIGVERDEDPNFAKDITIYAKEIYKELISKFVKKINQYRKEKQNINKINPWDTNAYPNEIIPIPIEEVIKFYENEIKEIFPKESQYIIDNFSKEGTLAVLEGENKYYSAATCWNSKNNIYFITQSYVDSIPYSASTLAHEMAHSMHIVASKLNKPIEDDRFSLAIGEAVADTFSVLFAFASMEKNTKYAKTIANETLERLLDVTGSFAIETLTEDAVYEMAWNGKEITPEIINETMYKQKLQFKKDEKPYILKGINYTKKNSMLRYTSVENHYSLSSYTISFILAIYFADQIRKGNKETFIKILNMGAEEYSINKILKLVNIDLKSKEVKDAIFKTVDEITNFITKK